MNYNALIHIAWMGISNFFHGQRSSLILSQIRITVEPVDVTWKITDLMLLKEKHIDSYAQLKSYGGLIL